MGSVSSNPTKKVIMSIIEFELDIKNSLGELLEHSFKTKMLVNTTINYDIDLNRSGEESNYFSEVEVTFWKEGNILDVISVIICINGQLRNTREEFLSWFIDETNKLFETLHYQ